MYIYIILTAFFFFFMDCKRASVTTPQPTQCCSAAARGCGMEDSVTKPTNVVLRLSSRRPHYVCTPYTLRVSVSCLLLLQFIHVPDVLMYKVNILICIVAKATSQPNGINVFFRDTPFERLESICPVALPCLPGQGVGAWRRNTLLPQARRERHGVLAGHDLEVGGPARSPPSQATTPDGVRPSSVPREARNQGCYGARPVRFCPRLAAPSCAAAEAAVTQVRPLQQSAINP